MRLFDEHAVQVEGWLKGELLPLFEIEKTDCRLIEFNTEVSCGYGRVDYHLIVPDEPIAAEVWLELKHFQIGRQGEYRWIASNYFTDKNIGIYRDVEKLTRIEHGDKYIFVLATKNPEYEKNGDWWQGVDKFNRKFSHLQIRSLTDPIDFPQSYYLGLLEVVGK